MKPEDTVEYWKQEAKRALSGNRYAYLEALALRRAEKAEAEVVELKKQLPKKQKDKGLKKDEGRPEDKWYHWTQMAKRPINHGTMMQQYTYWRGRDDLSLFFRLSTRAELKEFGDFLDERIKSLRDRRKNPK